MTILFLVQKIVQNNIYVKRVQLSLFEVIDDSAFSGCTNLSYINMPGTLKRIGNCAFYNTKLEDLYCPQALKIIDDCAFEDCSKMGNVYFNYGLEEIGNLAFKGTAVKAVDVPASVKKIGLKAFDETPLKRIIIRNPECELDVNFVPDNTTIYGYRGSTAEKYVEKYIYTWPGLRFVPLDPVPVNNNQTVTTTAKTTVSTTTTATTVVSTNILPNKECVMIAVNDKINADDTTNEILNDQNLRFFDQQSADGNGVASFSYVPNENENWTFMFISESIDDMIQRTVVTINDFKAEVESQIKGDANGDGEIDMSDAVLIMQALANPNKYGINGTDPKHISADGFKYADADGNGLTVNDAQRIQLYLLGKIGSLD